MGVGSKLVGDFVQPLMTRLLKKVGSSAFETSQVKTLSTFSPELLEALVKRSETDDTGVQTVTRLLSDHFNGNDEPLNRFISSNNYTQSQPINPPTLSEPTRPQWKYPTGKGSRAGVDDLRNQFLNWVDSQPGRKEELLSYKADRNDFGDIIDATGDVKSIEGVTGFLNGNFKHLTFPSKKVKYKAKVERLGRMQPPADELRAYALKQYPDNPELANQYLRTVGPGFKRVQEAARRNGLTLRQWTDELKTNTLTKKHEKILDQWDAGHWFSTKSSTGPGALEQAPTSGKSARLEPASINRSGGAKIEHDINPHLAELVGIPKNWKEDFELFVDFKSGKGELPVWESIIGNSEAMALVESLPYNASKKEALAVFNKIKEINRPENELAKTFSRDTRVEKSRSEQGIVDEPKFEDEYMSVLDWE